jgi:RimJ/RimL family protein N-acetyltransferase
MAPHRIAFLTGSRVYLRPLEPPDADRLWQEINNDKEGRRLTGTWRAFTRAEILAYIERRAGDMSRASFGVVRCEDDLRIGEVVNQGYGTEVIALMLDYGFGLLNLHRIELEVYTLSPRAAHVYEKPGFEREGLRRQNWYYSHQHCDSVVMSLPEDDYRARRGGSEAAAPAEERP